MTDGEALRAAIDLFYLPSKVRIVRTQPLPKGTGLLLRLAAGDTAATREAQTHSNRSASANTQAAVFFIEQVLLKPDADEYTILGLDPTANIAEFRAHMALLLKWLHPDISGDEYRSLMARRVIDAWNKIKSLDQHRKQTGVAGLSIQRPQDRRTSQYQLSAPLGLHERPRDPNGPDQLRAPFRSAPRRPLRLLRMLRLIVGYARSCGHSAQSSGE